MSDEQPRTVLQVLLDAGITEERAREHLAQGWVRSGGEIITDPDAPAPERFVINAG